VHKTDQVLLKGEYRGVLEPWKHYLPMERDFSNFDEIMNFILDDAELQNIDEMA
jgi:hypothetical protein